MLVDAIRYQVRDYRHHHRGISTLVLFIASAVTRPSFRGFTFRSSHHHALTLRCHRRSIGGPGDEANSNQGPQYHEYATLTAENLLTAWNPTYPL